MRRGNECVVNHWEMYLAEQPAVLCFIDYASFEYMKWKHLFHEGNWSPLSPSGSEQSQYEHSLMATKMNGEKPNAFREKNVHLRWL